MDEEVERFSESLRNHESHFLTQELSKFYKRLKILNEEERINPEGSDERERILDDQTLVKRKIGAIEEEMGRRKKNNSWVW